MTARRFPISVLAASCTVLLVGAGAGSVQAQPPVTGPTAGSTAGPMTAPPGPLIGNAQPVRSCESLAGVGLANTTIASAALDEENPDICRVTAIYSHPGADDAITIWFAAPMGGWNGRFVGTGGGGFSGGNPGGVNGPVSQGFATGATDTGHQGPGGSFALDDAGRLIWQRIRNNAHVGIHRMTVTGKALTEALYGNPPGYSYFNGCSAGGRQALMAVQRYPQDYDGIVSGAPAINWPELRVQQLWGPMLMNNEGNLVAQCKLASATAAAIAACDTIDGIQDGVIEDPTRCEFDPAEFVGTSIDQCGVFTAADASIVRRIWEGPRGEDGRFLWHGWADQQTTPHGTVDYFERVVEQMGGRRHTSRFMRLFMAPGVAHCGGGNGPAPTGLLDALVAWVEEGRAPDTIPAVLRGQDGEVIRTRPLCPYPQVAVHRGRGSTDEAENFVCRNGFR